MDLIIQNVENHREIFCKKRTNHPGTRANYRLRDSQTSSKEELGVWLETEGLFTVFRVLGERVRKRRSKRRSRKRKRSRGRSRRRSSGERRKSRRRRLQQVQQQTEGSGGRGREREVQGRKKNVFLS